MTDYFCNDTVRASVYTWVCGCGCVDGRVCICSCECVRACWFFFVVLARVRLYTSVFVS